jgi:hypothetical protein
MAGNKVLVTQDREQDTALALKAAEAGPAPTNGTETYREKLVFEEDKWPLVNLFDDPQADYWFWDYVYGGYPGWDTKRFILLAHGRASAGTAELRVELQGYSDSDADPDHHVIVKLNGQQIGESWWNGTEARTLMLSFDQSLLNDGTNTVEVTALKDTGAPYTIFYVGEFELRYDRHYQAVGDVLVARSDGNPVVTVAGFSRPDIKVFEVRGGQLQLITATTLDGGPGNYRVSFSPGATDTMFVAATQDGLRSPRSVVGDVESDLKDNTNQANYLVITPLMFKDAAQNLAGYRAGQGWQAKVVNLEDIYDEFNYGLSSPEAIRSFLTYAYHNWTQAPQYVVMAGEGSMDYRNLQAMGDSVVPPLMAGTPYGLFAADNLYGDIVGNDSMPEIAVGRLPALTEAELLTMIGKIKAYEAAADGLWEQQVLMLADDPDDGGNFPVDSDAVAGYIPPAYVVEKIYLSDYSKTDARQRLVAGINNGAVLVNYLGHANPIGLANGLFTNSDVTALSNSEQLPLVAGMTCLVGRYDWPGTDSLAETMILHDGGGSVAVWSPTGLSYNAEARLLDEALMQALFAGQQPVLGDVIKQALGTYAVQKNDQQFMLRIYNLLGDPATRLR